MEVAAVAAAVGVVVVVVVAAAAAAAVDTAARLSLSGTVIYKDRYKSCGHLIDRLTAG